MRDRVDPWLLVFDLDGTLIDSSLDLCLSVNAAMVHVGAAELPHTVITSYVGGGAASLVRRALERDGSGQTSGTEQEVQFKRAFAHFLEYYQQHKLDHTHLYEGVFSSLKIIRARIPDLPMAVLTNKPVRPSREICEALGVGAFFFANYGGNSFETKKPDPAGLLHLMYEARQHWHKLGVAPETLAASDAWMVGDSEADVITARRSGARSLGCLYGLSPKALALSKPDVLCGSPVEWPELLFRRH